MTSRTATVETSSARRSRSSARCATAPAASHPAEQDGDPEGSHRTRRQPPGRCPQPGRLLAAALEQIHPTILPADRLEG